MPELRGSRSAVCRRIVVRPRLRRHSARPPPYGDANMAHPPVALIPLTEPQTSPQLLSALNPVQREAAAYIGGPLLILAGAGSGKTRVLTYRVAHLISQGVPPG